MHLYIPKWLFVKLLSKIVLTTVHKVVYLQTSLAYYSMKMSGLSSFARKFGERRDGKMITHLESERLLLTFNFGNGYVSSRDRSSKPVLKYMYFSS